MTSDNLSKAMKVVSTITLGHLAGITSYKSSCVQPSLEEQSDVTAAAKVFFLFFSFLTSQDFLHNYSRSYLNYLIDKRFFSYF